MSTILNYKGFSAMLMAAVEVIREKADYLSDLDSHGGDGDHGTTMLRAMDNLKKAIEESSATQIGPLLDEIAWAVMGTDGGATGPLFGSLFMGMATPVATTESLDVHTLAAMFACGLESIQKQTKARVGDKTLMDALIPAVEAMNLAAKTTDDIVTVLKAGEEAATQGSESTKHIKARFGRAKNAGDQSLGHADPGSVSVSLLFQAFAKGVQTHGG